MHFFFRFRISNPVRKMEFSYDTKTRNKSIASDQSRIFRGQFLNPRSVTVQQHISRARYVFLSAKINLKTGSAAILAGR